MRVGTYIKELLDDHPGNGTELPMVAAIRKMRDEVTGLSMMRHRGQNRSLSMVIAKLDEAELWATRWAVESGRSMIVDREELLRSSETPTNATLTTQSGEGI